MLNINILLITAEAQKCDSSLRL